MSTISFESSNIIATSRERRSAIAMPQFLMKFEHKPSPGTLRNLKTDLDAEIQRSERLGGKTPEMQAVESFLVAVRELMRVIDDVEMKNPAQRPKDEGLRWSETNKKIIQAIMDCRQNPEVCRHLWQALSSVWHAHQLPETFFDNRKNGLLAEIAVCQALVRDKHNGRVEFSDPIKDTQEIDLVQTNLDQSKTYWQVKADSSNRHQRDNVLIQDTTNRRRQPIKLIRITSADFNDFFDPNTGKPTETLFEKILAERQFTKMRK